MRQLDIAASMYTMIAAGYETTATVISYTMYILSQYQDLQEKVYQVGVDVFLRVCFPLIIASMKL